VTDPARLLGLLERQQAVIASQRLALLEARAERDVLMLALARMTAASMRGFPDVLDMDPSAAPPPRRRRALGEIRRRHKQCEDCPATFEPRCNRQRRCLDCGARRRLTRNRHPEAASV
jgi:hypothetical protein